MCLVSLIIRDLVALCWCLNIRRSRHLFQLYRQGLAGKVLHQSAHPGTRVGDGMVSVDGLAAGVLGQLPAATWSAGGQAWCLGSLGQAGHLQPPAGARVQGKVGRSCHSPSPVGRVSLCWTAYAWGRGGGDG